MKIKHMAEYGDGDNRKWTPKQILEIALEEVKEGKTSLGQCNRMIIIGCNDSGGNYNTSYIASNLSVSQIVGMLEIQKHDFLKIRDGG